MTAAIVAMSLSLAVNSFGHGYSPAYDYADRHTHHHVDRILPPGPGYGWGFPGDSIDHYGWFDFGDYLPLNEDRIAEYYFPRYIAVPPSQMFLQTYYNCFETRGQRYIPYSGGGGDHAMGGPPAISNALPVAPYTDLNDSQPVTPVPRLNGRVEAPTLPSGGSGLTP
jgi:hypothetical protein